MNKTILKSSLLAAALALCFAASAQAKELKVKDEGGGKFTYLTEARIKAEAATFPPPPAPGSAQEKKDRLEVLDWQSARTDEQCAAALKQEEVGLTKFFSGSAYPFEGQPPEVLEFFNKVGTDTRLACRILKRHFKRLRPNMPGLVYCTTDVGSKYSYPSRHAATAFLFAILLSELDPPNREKYFRASDQAAQYRVISGVHYPSDITAGANFARDLYAEFCHHENFRKDLQALKKYLKKPATKK